MRKAVSLLFVLAALAAMALPLHAASWFWAYDGTGDPATTPSQIGETCYYHYNAGTNPNIYWYVTDNGSGGQALKWVDNDATANSEFRWTAYGLENLPPAQCASKAMDDFKADRRSLTMTFRVKVEDLTNANVNTHFRFWTGGYNIEMAGTLKLGMRPEWTIIKDTEGNVWIGDYRRNVKLAILKPFDAPGGWVKFWCKCVHRFDGTTNTYDNYVWVDKEDGNGWVQIPLAENNRNVGGGNAHLRFLSDINGGATGSILLDYFCISFDAADPGGIAIPAEKTVLTDPKIGALRTMPTGIRVEMTKQLVARFLDSSGVPLYYIEDADRSAGIKVIMKNGRGPTDPSGNPYTPVGNEKFVIGGSLGKLQCEQVIFADKMELVPEQLTPQECVGMNNRDVTLSFNKTLTSFIPAQTASGPAGTTNHGLLARIWGKVTWIGIDSNQNIAYYYVDDGTGFVDGSIKDAMDQPVKGIRVMLGNSTYIPTPPNFDYVSVEGFIGNVRSTIPTDQVVPVIWATNARTFP